MKITQRVVIYLSLILMPVSHLSHSSNITYIVYQESSGVYQIPQTPVFKDRKIGFIDAVITKIFLDHEIKLNTEVIPAMRALSRITQDPDFKWISLGFDQSAIKPSHEVWDLYSKETYNRLPLAKFTLYLFHKGVPTEKTIQPEDLKGKRIVMASSVTYSAFERAYAGSNFIRIPANSHTRAMKMLLAGRADYILMSNASKVWYQPLLRDSTIKLHRTSLPELEKSNTKHLVYLIWSTSIPQNTESHIKQKIELLETNGWLAQLREAYGLQAP